MPKTPFRTAMDLIAFGAPMTGPVSRHRGRRALH